MGLFDVTGRETLAGAGAKGRPRLGTMGISVGVVVEDGTGFFRLRTRVLVDLVFGTDKSNDFEWINGGG